MATSRTLRRQVDRHSRSGTPLWRMASRIRTSPPREQHRTNVDANLMICVLSLAHSPCRGDARSAQIPHTLVSVNRRSTSESGHWQSFLDHASNDRFRARSGHDRHRNGPPSLNVRKRGKGGRARPLCRMSASSQIQTFAGIEIWPARWLKPVHPGHLRWLPRMSASAFEARIVRRGRGQINLPICEPHQRHQLSK